MYILNIKIIFLYNFCIFVFINFNMVVPKLICCVKTHNKLFSIRLESSANVAKRVDKVRDKRLNQIL
jgi:hypothetical protein